MLRCVYWRSRGAPQATTISQYPCASRWLFPSDREHLSNDIHEGTHCDVCCDIDVSQQHPRFHLGVGRGSGKGQDLRRPQLTMIGAAELIARCFLAGSDVNKFVGASTGCVRVKWEH